VSGTCENPFTTEVIIEYRQHGAPDWQVAAFLSPNTTGTVIAGLVGDYSYDVAISYRTLYGVVSPRLEIDSVTTGTVATPVYVDGSTDPTPQVHSDQPSINLAQTAYSQLQFNDDDVESGYDHSGYIGLANDTGPDQNSTFWNNRGDVPKHLRIRTGDVTFVVEASAYVYANLTIWYSLNGGALNFLRNIDEIGGGVGFTEVKWVGDITIAADDYITFFMSPKTVGGTYYDGGHRELRNAILTVQALNN
jgi:hypothetical protein